MQKTKQIKLNTTSRGLAYVKKRKKTGDDFVYLGLFFFAGCFLGWLWESFVFFMSHDGYSMFDIILKFRGVLHGPWVPIYGCGCLLLFLIRELTSRKVLPFFVYGILSCGILEYMTSLILELWFGARWWDYSERLLNLNGRIYAGGLVFFGIAGTIILFAAEPYFRERVGKIPRKIQIILLGVLLLLFAADVLFSLRFPNTGIGVEVMR